MKKIFSITVIVFLFTGVMNAVAQTSPKDMEKLMVQKWFEGKEWLGGLQLQPHQTINEMEFARQYKANKVYWDKAFAFLKEHDLQTMANGKYPMDGDSVFAIVTENPTKDYDSTQWESHRGYIDLHCVISGEEKIGIYPITKLTVTKPYDGSKDVANYSGEGKIYSAVPGVFFLFFPSDAHRPGITPGGKKTDKKIVIKIRYTE
ncbi:MAG: YhcH/YjgK/YiaL family protein [Ginsengibacter sp.]